MNEKSQPLIPSCLVILAAMLVILSLLCISGALLLVLGLNGGGF